MKKMILDLHPNMDEMLNKKAEDMMLNRTAVVRLAIKEYCEVKQ